MMTFPPASLPAQLAELERTRTTRLTRDDELDLSAKRATRLEIDHRNNALDGAIATLGRLKAAQERGEPGRNELVDALRDALAFLRTEAVGGVALRVRIDDLLTRIPT